jgi:hypothetical protein
MRAAVEFYDELQLGAVEIDDESLEHMLATELEAEHAAIAERGPRMPFCGGRLKAQLSGQGELPPDGDAPQWIHASRLTVSHETVSSNSCGEHRVHALALSPPSPAGRGGQGVRTCRETGPGVSLNQEEMAQDPTATSP